ncbi:MAG: TonB-dependent receptor [Bacteroidetes bacterium]|nr:MAG: TonB-dependent receptor [Bacteroidota bacterium]
MFYLRSFGLIILFLCSSAQIIFAQYSLSGIIGGDSKETQLLEGVQIYIPEINRVDFSKEGGTYIFRDIGAGVIHVQFSKIGFKTVLKTILIKDSATVVHVNLESSGSSDKEVLSLSGYSDMSPSVPNAIETLSRNEFVESGAMNPALALSYKPGLDYISEGNGFAKPVIRAFSNNKIQLRQFGSRIENQTWYDRSSPGFNTNGADGFEIIKGPSSLLYGADALGGVIILNEEKPSPAGTISGEFNGEFHSSSLGYNVEAGLKGQTRSGVFYGLRLGNLSHTSYVQGDGSDVRKNSEDLDFAINSKFNNQNLKFYTGLTKAWGMSRLTFSYMQQEAGIIGFEDSVYNDPFRYNEIQRERSFSLPYIGTESMILSSQNTILAGHSKLELNLSYQQNNNREFQSSGQENPSTFALDLSTITYDLKYSSDPLKKVGYTIGSQGYFQSNDNIQTEGLIPDSKISNLGAFVMMRYDLKRWNFLAGARIDTRRLELKSNIVPVDEFDARKNSVTNDYLPLSGSAGFVYHASDKVYFKLNGATAYAAPDYLQLYSYGMSSDTARFIYGSDSLNLETNAGLDLSFHIDQKSFSLGATFFYNALQNFTHLVNTGGLRAVTLSANDTLLPVYYFTQSDANLSGAEISVAIHPIAAQWFRLNLAYSTQTGKFKDAGDLTGLSGDKAIVALQFQSEKMNYLYGPYIRIILRNYSAQSLTNELQTAAPGYSLVDFQLGGRIKIARQFLHVSVAVNNLMNESYSNQLSRLPSGIHEMGRNVCIRLSMPFAIMKMK